MATDIHTLIGTFTAYLWPDFKKNILNTNVLKMLNFQNGFHNFSRNSWLIYDLHDECRYHDLDVTHSCDVCNNSFSSCFEADVQKKPRLINLSGQSR